MPSRFAHRSTAIEIMDDLNCSGEVVEQTLRELELINRTLGGNAVSVEGVMSLTERPIPDPISILDLGCGGGDMLLLLQQKFKKLNKPAATFMGIDANPNIVNYASHHGQHASISFAVMDILSAQFRQLTCDIALATLFFHHFTEDQLIDILRHLNRQARIGIVINDLHRHPLAYYSIKVLTKLFSKSAMVKYDAPLSVLRGFSKQELVTILERAGIENYTIVWKWAFRWQVVIKVRQ